MADDPIIIVDDKGTEHEFPPGFDPVRAAGIVRAQSGQRKDANAIGFDVNKWTDLASKLPESVLGVPVRWPAAAAGTLLGTTVEGLSAPETIGTLGAARRVPNASPNYLPPSILGKVNAMGRMIEGSPSAGGKVGLMQRALGRVLQIPKEPMARGVEPFGAPQVSRYVAGETGSSAAEAIPGVTTSLDRFGGNTSGYTAGEAANTASQALPGVSMPQATYVPIPPEFVHVYGDWGLAGPSLQEGMLVNATNRAGEMGLQKVGPMLTLPNGSQIATIGK